MLNKLISFLCAISLLAGCAGRAANPVTVNQFGDEKKSCQAIKSELRNIDNNVQRLIPESNKTGKNAALGVVGLIVWPAWLFMDLSNAEKEEINAYRNRHDRLVSIAEAKIVQFKLANA
ncbi:MAG: hypothetical protein HYX61_13375 [Gammaproteobacteria bacterium]|nr:hypothetical protein [Gammaproteobacteria bacterium]